MSMKKFVTALFAIALLATSCEEWGPVLTLEYDNPAEYGKVTLQRTHTIGELAAMYTAGKPWKIDRNIIIAGQVISTDQPGNFYKSLYIQDETGGIELKLGKNGLYNDYKPGQWIYVKCLGLTLGMYGYKSGNYGGQGMVQLGVDDPTGSYETAYIESPLMIDAHIIRGEIARAVQPEVITSSDLPNGKQTQAKNRNIGRLVTLKGLHYANEAFVLLYIDSNKDKKASSNRIFLSDKPWGITTWAMSKDKMTEYLCSGVWDSCEIGNSGDYNYGTVGDRRVVAADGTVTYPSIEKAAYSVSQYFDMNGAQIQLRTSGYSKFSDAQIPAEVLDGSKSVSMTGVLTMYQGSIQFIVNSLADIVVE